jgi:flagellar basal body-associated protein FliL
VKKKEKAQSNFRAKGNSSIFIIIIIIIIMFYLAQQD